MRLARSLTTLLFFAAAGLFAAMWYYADQLNQGAFIPDTTTPAANVRVVEVDEGRILLQALEGSSDTTWSKDGVYGIEWPGGYGRVGRVIDTHPEGVLREFTILDAAPASGAEARIDTFTYRGDPRTAHGIAFEDISIASADGEGPAWLVPGSGATWVIFVHGKGASREEGLRILPTLTALGLPTLLLTYRNDPDYTAIDDGRYGYGQTEWRELAAAMDYARARGASRFVLLGNSMGGAIVMALLQQPQYASQVSAVILDSPVLDLKRTVQFRASQRNLPGVFTSAALQFATWRDGIDWPSMDYVRTASSLEAPILLFHGDADRTVPIATSDSLAQARPDLVTYRRLVGVSHVQGWNADRESYTLQVREFLLRVLDR